MIPAFLSSRRALASLLLVLLLASLYLAGGLALSRGYSAEDAARIEVQRTRGMLSELADLTVVLLDAETAAQAFLLTGNETNLANFTEARNRLDGVLIRLDAAARASSIEGPLRTGPVKTRARERMAALEQIVAPRGPMSRTALSREVETGRRVMAQLRREIDALRLPEVARLETAFADADTQRRRVRLALVLIGASTAALAVLAAVLAFRMAGAEARMAFLERIEAERDRADLVSRELSHRVKNLFAVILSIISLTARTERDPKIAGEKSRLRIQALARAYELSSQQSRLGTAELGDLLRGVVGAYAPGPDRLFLHGPRVVLPARLMTPVGLIVNELATNALKYGAWSRPEGTLSVSWAFGQHCRLHLGWMEQGPSGGSDGDRGEGFGSRMIELSLAQAAGSMERRWSENGLEIELVFDLLEEELAAALVPVG